MSSRERWTIYPLLFFSIGLALYNRTASSLQVETSVVKCDVLDCRRVRVLGANGQEQASLTERGLMTHAVSITAPGGEERILLDIGPTDAGQFQLLSGNGQRRVAFGSDEKNQSGEVAIFGQAPELPLVLLSAENGGGSISTQTAEGKRQTLITHANGAGTIVSFDAEGKPRFYLTASLRPSGTGGPAQPETEANPPAAENPSAEGNPPDGEAPPAETPSAPSSP